MLVKNITGAARLLINEKNTVRLYSIFKLFIVTFAKPALGDALMHTLFLFYKHTIFWAKPLKEIKITTNKLTTIQAIYSLACL